MKLSLGDHRNGRSWAAKLRHERLKRFLNLIPNDLRTVRIVDVGGTEAFWANAWNDSFNRFLITIVNISEESVSNRYPIRAVRADARDLSCFSDREFHLCFSNSVIEHVGTLADQAMMAREIRRIAEGYFIQTPYRYFPIEPHCHFPGWAQIPIWLRTLLHQRFNMGYLDPEKDYLQARMDVEQIRLLSKLEFGLLFPDGRIVAERVGPFTKSLMAIRRPLWERRLGRLTTNPALVPG